LQPFAHAPFVIVTLVMLWMTTLSVIPIGIANRGFVSVPGLGVATVSPDAANRYRRRQAVDDYAGDILIEIDPTNDWADRHGAAPNAKYITGAFELEYVVARIAGPLIAEHTGCQFSEARHVQSEIQSNRRAACVDNAFHGRHGKVMLSA
jgi:hypothetical protein